MFKKDFILRLVEEVAKMIAKILGLLKEGNHEEAEFWLKKGYNLLKADEERLLKMSPADLVKELEKNQEFDFVKMELMADLIYAEAEILNAKKDEESKNMYIRALAVYHYIDNNHTVYSFERNDKILNLQEKLGEGDNDYN
jgi:hypothetical protein